MPSKRSRSSSSSSGRSRKKRRKRSKSKRKEEENRAHAQKAAIEERLRKGEEDEREQIEQEERQRRQAELQARMMAMQTNSVQPPQAQLLNHMLHSTIVTIPVMPTLDPQNEVTQVEAFIAQNKLDQRAAMTLREKGKDIQRAVLSRGALSDASNPSAACLQRIKDAQINQRMGGGHAASGSSAPVTVEEFIAANALDERAASALREKSQDIQQFVMVRGGFHDQRNPSAACLQRIKEAQLVGKGVTKEIPHGTHVAQVEDFIRENHLDERAGNVLKEKTKEIQAHVMARGNLHDCSNPSAACMQRINDAQMALRNQPKKSDISNDPQAQVNAHAQAYVQACEQMAQLQAGGLLPPGMVPDPNMLAAMGADSQALHSFAVAQNPQIAKAFILGAVKGLTELSERETDPTAKATIGSDLAIQQSKLADFNASNPEVGLMTGAPQHAAGNSQAALDASVPSMMMMLPGMPGVPGMPAFGAPPIQVLPNGPTVPPVDQMPPTPAQSLGQKAFKVSGFKSLNLNNLYFESKDRSLDIAGRPTFWTKDNAMLMYFQKANDVWAISPKFDGQKDLWQSVQQGETPGLAQQKNDKDWLEFFEGSWVEASLTVEEQIL